ncbi:MAG: non-heme iron oxygenase ferredoxin subunit [Patescibacteria group bacterium]
METNPILRIFRRFFGKAPTAAPAGSDQGVRIGSVNDVEEGKAFCGSLGGREIAVFKTKDGYAAIDNVCPHVGGPLCKGKLENGVIECPWHKSKFDVSTGALVGGPAKVGVAAYKVERRGDDLYIMGIPAAKPAPKAAVLKYGAAFDKEKPFDHEPFLKELIDGLKFPFKLYGVLPFIVIAQSPDEIDAHLGQVHVTEIDLKKLSELMAGLNKKWGTDATYCLFHTSQFPGDMVLNVRGPKAPAAKEGDIKY